MRLRLLVVALLSAAVSGGCANVSLQQLAENPGTVSDRDLCVALAIAASESNISYRDNIFREIKQRSITGSQCVQYQENYRNGHSSAEGLLLLGAMISGVKAGAYGKSQPSFLAPTQEQSTLNTYQLQSQWLSGGHRFCRYANGNVLNVQYAICPMDIKN